MIYSRLLDLNKYFTPTQDFTEATGVHLKARDMRGMSYIEIVKWENEYRSEEQITMVRTMRVLRHACLDSCCIDS